MKKLLTKVLTKKGVTMKDYQNIYVKWANYPKLPMELAQELKDIKNNEPEIQERFYKNLEFGTAGLRGIIGAGTNRMNIFTVRKASQGLANFLNKTGLPQSVVIAYDSRHKSREFALQSALVLAKNNIKVYLFNEIAATPLLSYAVSQLNTTSGIVITASHNPKEYNGYKVYTNYGGQIIDQEAAAITAEIDSIEDELIIELLDEAEAIKRELLVWLDDHIYHSYLKYLKELVLNKEVISNMAEKMNIVYTPLHGTGHLPVKHALEQIGFRNVSIVEEQSIAHPDFPTVKYPNPEDYNAFALSLKLAEQINADIIMATDPDADRVGVMVKDNTNKYFLLTGNQLGALFIDYILQMRVANNTLPQNAIIIKTIVTSSMGVDIAKNYGVDFLDVLTGFKYIGEKIAQYDRDKRRTFLFGYEESFGFLIGDKVRDKDAVQACILAAEMATFYKAQNISLLERLEQLFDEIGYYQETLININLEGIGGQAKIKKIINYLRQNPPSTLSNLSISINADYLTGCAINNFTKEKQTTELPCCNVLQYTLEDGSWLCIRPSGTEPKLKIYLGVKDTSAQKAVNKITSLKKDFMQLVNSIE